MHVLDCFVIARARIPYVRASLAQGKFSYILIFLYIKCLAQYSAQPFMNYLKLCAALAQASQHIYEFWLTHLVHLAQLLEAIYCCFARKDCASSSTLVSLRRPVASRSPEYAVTAMEASGIVHSGTQLGKIESSAGAAVRWVARLILG